MVTVRLDISLEDANLLLDILNVAGGTNEATNTHGPEQVAAARLLYSYTTLAKEQAIRGAATVADPDSNVLHATAGAPFERPSGPA